MGLEKINRKQAILILLHDNFEIFEKNLELLDSHFFDIFIHLDKSSDSAVFNRIITTVKYSRVYLVEDRINIRWGDYSIVQAELALLKLAYNTDNYLYYHLISGTDFILDTPKSIYHFFVNNQGTEFIHFFDISKNKKFYYNRYLYKYHLSYPKKKNSFTKAFYQSYIFMNQAIQRLFKLSNNASLCEFYLGSQWFSITGDCVAFILGKENLIDKMFNKTLVPDECFLQTIIVMNEDTHSRIVKNNQSYNSIKREIIFENGKPRVWTIDDKDIIKYSEALFIRKLQKGLSDDLVDYLFNKIKRKKEDGL